MKRLPLLVFFAMSAFGQMAAIQKVYILPMPGGLDQYLAEWLTREHVMQVVADPKLADAVLTDRIGEAFEQKLEKIHPLDDDDDTPANAHPGFRSGMNQGTIFLVDAKSRHVVWSDFEKPPRSGSGAAMNRRAGRIAKKLHEAFGK
jgi:hypothetical protein